MKIVTILGARPQFIKASVVSKQLSLNHISEILVHTGQHFDKNMSDIFFEEMQIPKPAYNLNIHGLSHGAMTGQMLEKTEDLLNLEKPDYVMVYGDTNSTLAGALAAVKMHIPVIHVEAGLRSFNLHMPEEVNRILTDRISKILFCPTDTAMQNLQKEGFAQFGVEISKSGDVMEDSAIHFNRIAQDKSRILDTLGLKPGAFVLATIHRAENTDNPEKLRAIFEALDDINTIKTVVLPLHPRTSNLLAKYGITTQVRIIEPIGYLDMTMLTSNAGLILTDSGGLQKEAFFFDKYCITLREETEWVELVNNGYNFLAGSDALKIRETFHKVNGLTFDKRHQFYGGGNASKNIAAYLAAKQ